jgi:methyltransferase family protein
VAQMDAWLAALTQRHTANLTSAELTHALRALSSCYVERRGRIARGAALEGAGKRAAFATFYGPLHFLAITEIVRALGARDRAPDAIVDLGCGTGVSGAAWALACGAHTRVTGIDRSSWAVGEAKWTYAQLGVHGTAKTGDITRTPMPASPQSAVLLGYAVNELDGTARSNLLTKLVGAVRAGTRMLVVEAIALRDKPWWSEWTRVLEPEGARQHEWRFDADIPPSIRELGRRAGLAQKELTARTISNL